jgi:hypothetical protein
MTTLNYEHLTTNERLEITAAWLYNAEHDAVIKRHAVLLAARPGVEEAHEALLRFQRGGESGALHAAALKGWDQVHDVKATGGYDVLTGAYQLTGDAAVRSCLELLYPRGRRIVQAGYAEEAGEAKRIEANMTDAHRATLRGLALPDGSTLLDHVNARLEAGRKLSELSQDRAERANAPAPAGPSEHALGLRWIEVVRTFVQLIDTFRVPAQDAELLLARLRELQPTR